MHLETVAIIAKRECFAGSDGYLSPQVVAEVNGKDSEGVKCDWCEFLKYMIAWAICELALAEKKCGGE